MAAPPTKTGGFSLYADLLDPQKHSASTISGAPVKYDIQRHGSSGGDEEAQQKKKDASLKFQPIKRPLVQKKGKSKQPSSSSSTHRPSSSTVTAATASSPDKQQAQLPSSTPLQPQSSAQKSNFEDWVGDEEDGFFYQDNRARGGKKRKKKGNKVQERSWDWDDIYDPTMPNNYSDYKGSEEQHREIRDWKARLYYHQLREAKKGQKNGAAHSDDEEEAERRQRPSNMMFAPPLGMNFAPPSFNNDNVAPRAQPDDDDDYLPQLSDSQPPMRPHEAPMSFAPASVPDDADDESAYMRRMQMAEVAPATSMSPPVAPPASSTPPAVAHTTATDLDAKRAEAQAKIAAFKAKLQKQTQKPNTPPAVPPPPPPSEPAPPGPTQQPPFLPVAPQPPPPRQEPGSTISRAPVRYEQPGPPPDLPGNGDNDSPMADADQPPLDSEDQPRSSRPGQKGFAERLLKKYGWEKGQGLGASGEGITTAIIAKADKRKKKSDAQGGGWAAPANMGKIVGGKKRKVEGDPNITAEEGTVTSDPRFGKMSEVIKLESMLDGLDVQHEIEENNLMQEIGDEMASQYGNVERVFIWRREMGGGDEVFVKFTSQLSALRAVNGMSGVEFAGNEVKARFWDAEGFERGEYA